MVVLLTIVYWRFMYMHTCYTWTYMRTLYRKLLPQSGPQPGTVIPK